MLPPLPKFGSTIVQNKLPISIFVVNNNGYHTIKNTQNNFFKGHNVIGIGEESGDLSFPDMKKLAGAYGFKYKSCDKTKDLKGFIEWEMPMDAVIAIEETIKDLKTIQEDT